MLIRRARRTVWAGRLLQWILIALLSISAIALHQLSHQHGMALAAPAAWHRVAVSHAASTGHLVSTGYLASDSGLGGTGYQASHSGLGSHLAGEPAPIVESGLVETGLVETGLIGEPASIVETWPAAIVAAWPAEICQESCQPVAAVTICLMAFVLLGRGLLRRARLLLRWVERWVWRAARKVGIAGRWIRVRLWWPEVSAQLLGISRT